MNDTRITPVKPKVKGLPDGVCVNSFSEFIKLLEDYLVIEIPGTVSNVVVGVNQPAENERSKIWFRVDNSSSFIGIYVYSGGSWQKIYPLTGQVFWVHGDSRNVDPGFKLIDENNSQFTAAEANFFKSLYLPNPIDASFYTYFAVTYEGF